MNTITKKVRSKVFIGALGLCLSILLTSIYSDDTNAVVGFNAGRIIDDAVMTKSSSMNVYQIQAFLNSKSTTCDTNGTQPATDFGRPDLTHAQYAALKKWSPPPYTCLKSYRENGLSAPQIIYNAAQQYHINPQVLIVLLQKEQGLVTDTWPLATQYKAATGYGCPDSTPGVCDSTYNGFTNQVKNAAKLFHSVVTSSPTWYSPYVLGNNFIQWNPNASCGGSTVNIQNLSTASLYDYTPYRPNQAALNAGYGTGDSCSSYGNRNFYLYFTDWFGSTYSSVYKGVDYSAVYNVDYYLTRYPSLRLAFGNNIDAALSHFVNYGMREGRQASDDFNVTSYRNRYQDLRIAYGDNLKAYYIHYMYYGKKEGRIATGDIPILNPVTIYKSVSYSLVYNFNTYTTKYTDLKAAFGNDDIAALSHFVNYGMREGRQASDDFNVTSYRNRYQDLRIAYGDNLKAYYIHYMYYGKKEGRIAT